MQVAASMMKFTWLKLLLLGTFAFWASGTAKYTHEQLEHHGRDASVDNDDDDDDSVATPVPVSSAPTQPGQEQKHEHHPCPICQMMAAMSVDRSAPPALPQLVTDCVATIEIVDHAAPDLHTRYVLPARGPPADATV
jgi:hypothetical protein